GPNAEHVSARWNFVEVGRAPVFNILPVRVAPLQFYLESHLVRGGKARSRVLDLDSAAAGGQPYRVFEWTREVRFSFGCATFFTFSAVINHRFDVDRRRRGVQPQTRRVDHGDTLESREPQPALAITGTGRLISARALQARQAIA